MGQRQGYCPTCGREGLTADDFPKSTHGYIHNICTLCMNAASQRYRDELVADPVAHARFKAKERIRLREWRRRNGAGTRPMGRPRKERANIWSD